VRFDMIGIDKICVHNHSIFFLLNTILISQCLTLWLVYNKEMLFKCATLPFYLLKNFFEKENIKIQNSKFTCIWLNLPSNDYHFSTSSYGW